MREGRVRVGVAVRCLMGVTRILQVERSHTTLLRGWWVCVGLPRACLHAKQGKVAAASPPLRLQRAHPKPRGRPCEHAGQMSSDQNPFQTHFLNVWPANGPRPSGSMCLKYSASPIFFDQATPTVFDARDPQGHFSKKHFPAKIVPFDGTSH